MLAWRAAGQHVPALDERVEPYEDLAQVRWAFDMASLRRDPGRRIALADLGAACDALGVTDAQERADTLLMLLALDETWYAWYAETQVQPAGAARG